MIFGIYTIKDTLTEFDKNLSVYASDAVAARAFLNACKVPNSVLALNPSDFMIYKVGEYDTSTGIVSQVVPTAVNIDIVSRETSDLRKEDV